jgi:hypothetical protein
LYQDGKIHHECVIINDISRRFGENHFLQVVKQLIQLKEWYQNSQKRDS